MYGYSQTRCPDSEKLPTTLTKFVACTKLTNTLHCDQEVRHENRFPLGLLGLYEEDQSNKQNKGCSPQPFPTRGLNPFHSSIPFTHVPENNPVLVQAS